jgi:hypothetical protein
LDPREGGLHRDRRVRRFIGRLHEELPYFPAFLDLSPQRGMFALYFLALAEESAQKGNLVKLRDQSLLERVLESTIGTIEFCEKNGIPTAPALENLLRVYSPKAAATLVSIARGETPEQPPIFDG